jgi:small-conductance mechanosensitive channel
MNEQIVIFFSNWGPSICILLFGIIAGWIFKRYIHKRLAFLVKKTQWGGDDVILKALEPQIILWFFLVAFFIASTSIQVSGPFLKYLEKIILIILILSVTFVLNRILVGLLQLWAGRQEGGFPSTTMFTNLVRITVFIIGGLIILDSLNISITPMLTALGVGGLAISLALKDTLADVFSGLNILLSQKVKPGDFVQLDSGEMGYVQNITWRNTTLLERANNIISIPNSKLSTTIVRNYDTIESSFSVRASVGVSYDSDLEKVEEVVLDVANGVLNDLDGVVKEHPPALRYKLFGDSSIDIAVYFRGKKYGDQSLIIHEFIKRIHKRFKSEGIDIPYPIRTIIQK